VRLENVHRRKVPTTTIHSLRINIDPFSQKDRSNWVIATARAGQWKTASRNVAGFDARITLG